MRNNPKRLTIAFFVVALATPVWADTDYQCLNSCVNSGETSAKCLQKCSYKNSKNEAENRTAKRKGYEQFAAPVPTKKIILPNSMSKSGVKSNKDYACFDQCLKQGLQYQLCEEKCVIK